MKRLCKVGLVLGGGGARGLAHLGVLSVLEREGIPVDSITGTSMGALVAAMYALTPQSDLVIGRFRDYLQSREFRQTNLDFLHLHSDPDAPRLDGIFQRFTSFIKRGFFYSQCLTRRAPISEEDYAQHINFLVDDIRIEETRMPLAIIALDLKTAEEVVLREGSLRKAVSASCAIPGVLPPVKIGVRELVDGGWIDQIPVRPARASGADLVIAVDVSDNPEEEEGDCHTGLEIVLRTQEISRCALNQLRLEEADVVISPEVSAVHWSDFGHLEECLQAGEGAAREQLDLIKNRLWKKKISKMLKLPLGLAR